MLVIASFRPFPLKVLPDKVAFCLGEEIFLNMLGRLIGELNRYRGLVVDRSACILFSIPQSFHILRI